MRPEENEDAVFFQKQFNVSRETIQKFFLYYEALEKWSSKINLVSKTTLKDFWLRHIIDSAQLINHINENDKKWLDFGSGAGFPGVVVARLLQDRQIDYQLNIIEMNTKRCAFLREAARILDIKINIYNNKIEEVIPFKIDVITARAFAPLSQIFELALPYSQLGARFLLLKGEELQIEMKQASTNWKFQSKISKSISHANGQIIEISELERDKNL